MKYHINMTYEFRKKCKYNVLYLNMKLNIDNKSLALECVDIAAAKFIVLRLMC